MLHKKKYLQFSLEKCKLVIKEIVQSALLQLLQICCTKYAIFLIAHAILIHVNIISMKSNHRGI